MPTLIDTREAFRRLREQGGFTDDQADAIVDIFTDVDEQVATRGDIERLEEKIESESARLDEKIESETGRLDEKIDEVEERLTQRIELSEERLGQRIQEVRSSIVASVAAVGAVLAVVIPLVIYLLG